MPFKTPYGFTLEKELKPLELELFCYRWHSTLPGITTDRFFHFKNIVDMIWGPNNKRKHFQWNPWAEKSLRTMHEHPVTGQQNPHVGLSGCASSGKSDDAAIYGLVNWLADPLNTMVLVTSTDLKASRKRIWGALTEYWLHGLNGWAPGKLVESQGLLVTIDPTSGNKFSDKSGISLIACERKKEKEAVGKIIGMKSKRVIFLGDELPELPESITEAAFGNLSSNDFFQFIAMGNFKSWYDTFGQLIKPKSGNLEEITEDVDEYETEKGYCLIFDGLKSPNILSGKDEWNGIYGSKQLASHRRDFGENSATFWRMCRSRPTPLGLDNAIYSDSDFIAAQTNHPVIWRTGFVRVSSLDPAYTNGGDRSVQWIGKFGENIDGGYCLELESFKLLREDVRKKDRPRNFQIAEQFRDNCVALNISPENAALDSTGAGGPFADIVSEVWSNRILRVDFSGKPSEMMVSAGSPKTADQLYDRRVTELWYVGVEFLKAKQLRGLTDDLKREMKARHYETVKGADGLKMKVETKTDMKTRLNFSPDLADSFFILLELLRVRHGFLAGGTTGGFALAAKSWDEQVKLSNQVYVTVDYSPQEVAA